MRRYERHKFDVPVLVKKSDGGSALQLQGHCVNLSAGGAGCILSARLVPGEFVILEVCLPGMPERVTVGARVRHSERYFHGFEFVAPSSNVVNEIRSACDSVGPRRDCIQ